MAVTAQQVIDEARKWLGIKYANQGRTERGLDCGGLLLVVGRALGLTELEHLGYAASPDGETFQRLLDENCIPVKPYNKPRIGDLLAHDYKSGIQHTSLVTALEPRLTVIHAKKPAGVVEQYLHGYELRGWVQTYRIKGLADK